MNCLWALEVVSLKVQEKTRDFDSLPLKLAEEAQPSQGTEERQPLELGAVSVRTGLPRRLHTTAGTVGCVL